MKLLEDNKNAIISEYIVGKSVQQLAVDYNVSDWSVKNFLIKNEIPTRTVVDLRIKYYETFFQAEKAELYYFWGFVLGDGSLGGGEGTKQKDTFLTITLDACDRCILEKYCDWLHLDHDEIKIYKNGETVRLNIYADYCKNDLSQFGIVKYKTYYPVLPNIPDQYIKPFLMGLIDADGHITFDYKEGYGIEIVGNEILMDWFIDQIKLLGYNGPVVTQFIKAKSNKIRNEISKRTGKEKSNIGFKRIRIRRKEDVINLINIFDVLNYSSFLLNRKWKNIIDFLSGTYKIPEERPTKSEIEEIRNLILSGDMLQKDIAKMYNLNRKTITNIKYGRCLKYQSP